MTTGSTYRLLDVLLIFSYPPTVGIFAKLFDNNSTLYDAYDEKTSPFFFCSVALWPIDDMVTAEHSIR